MSLSRVSCSLLSRHLTPRFCCSARDRHDRRYWHPYEKGDQTFNKWSFPYQHGFNDSLDYKVDGVSDKQFPVMLQWERPKHIRRTEPGFDGSGDLEGLPDVDEAALRLEFEDSEEIQKLADEEIKKVFTLEYGRSQDKMALIKKSIVSRVQRHHHDWDSLEVHIALVTMSIRNMQAKLKERPSKSGVPWHIVRILVDRRRGFLRRLRERDIKKFQWLLETLNIVYKPRPFFWEKVERKKCLTRLTDLWCNELHQHRLNELKFELQSQQPAYLREKAETLKWMMKEETELGMTPTVSQSDIDDCERRAQEIEKALQERPPEEEQFFIFKPEVEDTTRKYIA